VYNPTPNWQQQGSFVEPVPIPASHPGDSPLVTVQINAGWIPYVLGGVWQLAQPTTWIDTGGSAITDVLHDVQDLMSLFGGAPASRAGAGMFNGIDDKITIGPAAVFDRHTSNNFSILAWVWLAGVGTMAAQDRNTTGGSGYFLASFPSGGVRQIYGGLNNGTTAANNNAGSIFFGLAAVTYDGAHLRTFYNGSLVNSLATSISPAYSGSQPFVIGFTAGTGYFSGLMKDIQYYQGRVPDADIATIYAAGGGVSLAATLAGRWKLDEGSGTTAHDSSGNGNNGTWAGTGPLWATWPT